MDAFAFDPKANGMTMSSVDVPTMLRRSTGQRVFVY